MKFKRSIFDDFLVFPNEILTVGIKGNHREFQKTELLTLILVYLRAQEDFGNVLGLYK